ncbi:hypothetical protein KUCAC02_000726, partial [Chaenocephalus aceratus]
GGHIEVTQTDTVFRDTLPPKDYNIGFSFEANATDGFLSPQRPMAGQVWAALENRGNRETGRRRWGTVCRTWLFRSVDPIRRVVTCLVRGYVPPERHAGGAGLREWEHRVNTAELASEAFLTVSTYAVLDYMCRETGNMRKSQVA